MRYPLQGIRHKFAHGESSDHLLFLNLYKTWQYEYDKGKSKKFCRENYVNNFCCFAISMSELRRE